MPKASSMLFSFTYSTEFCFSDLRLWAFIPHLQQHSYGHKVAFCLSPGGCWIKSSQHIWDHFFWKPGSSRSCLDSPSKWEVWVKWSLQLEGIEDTQVSRLLCCHKEQRREATWIGRKCINTDTIMQSQSKAAVCKKWWIYHVKWDLSCYSKSMLTCLSVFHIKPSLCAVSACDSIVLYSTLFIPVWFYYFLSYPLHSVSFFNKLKNSKSI